MCNWCNIQYKSSDYGRKFKDFSHVYKLYTIRQNDSLLTAQEIQESLQLSEICEHQLFLVWFNAILSNYKLKVVYGDLKEILTNCSNPRIFPPVLHVHPRNGI